MKKQLATLSLLTLALTACGGNASSDSSPSTSETTSTTASEPATPTPSASETTSVEATTEPPESESPIAEATTEAVAAPADDVVNPNLSSEVLDWQQTYGLPYYAIVGEDGTTRWFDMQNNPTSAQPQWFSTYPFTADERERIAIALDRVGQQIQENITELEASMEAYNPTTDPAYDSTPAPVESSDPIGGDQGAYDNQQVSEPYISLEQCQQIVNSTTSSSGEIQYCHITYGI